MSETVKINMIRTDCGTQPRGKTSEANVARLVDAITEGAKLPPVKLVFDGESYYPYDGFHRIEAHKEHGMYDIEADVKQGTLDDALWLSYHANIEHDAAGIPRSNGDKRRAVEGALAHELGSSMSDGKIAEWCAVTRQFVSKIRSELTSNNCESQTERTGRDGRTINTSNIGKSKPEATTEKVRNIVDKQTGEILDNAAVVTTTTKTETLAPEEAGDADTILATLESIYEMLQGISDLKPAAARKPELQQIALKVQQEFAKVRGIIS